MRILYNLVFILFGIAYLPYLFFTGRYKYGMSDRLGMLSDRLIKYCPDKKIIWIHAVSMGEMKLAGILAPALRERFPEYNLIFSSVTHTGNIIAGKIAGDTEEIFYLPFDLSFITDKVVRIIRPDVFICLETELWPNIISSLHKSGCRIILANGRISDDSFKGYRKIKFVISGILKKFSLILMQSEIDKKRILELGAPKEKVFATGSLKFDLVLSGAADKRKELREKLGLKNGELLLTAGSTHRGEDEIIIRCYKKLKEKHKNLRLLIAPRHPERSSEIEKLFLKHGFKAIRFSSLSNSYPLSPVAYPLYILDTVGNLNEMYSASDIVFMGGSLVRKGGQNPIEPANFSRPIITGKSVFNFRDVVRALMDNGGCALVNNEKELYITLFRLLDSPQYREKMGAKAKKTIIDNRGSLSKAIDLIRKVLH